MFVVPFLPWAVETRFVKIGMWRFAEDGSARSPIWHNLGDKTMSYDGQMIDLSQEPRFLITRLSAVGDCVHTIPIVHALRDRYPKCFIAWATQSGPATLLDGIAGIDELVRVPRDWMKSPRSWWQVRRQLRPMRIEVSIDPQSLSKSSMLGWLSGAKHRIGFERPQGRELSLLTNRLRIHPASEHVVDRYLELLKPLGIRQPAVRFDMPDLSEVAVLTFLDANGLDETSGFAVVNPGAGWPSKVWPAERYGAIAAHLGATHQVRTVVTWSGDDELEMARSICDAADGFAILAEPTSLPELRSLVRRAKLFVGSDTGPMHLAVAVGTPCVSIYGPTSPARCGPYGPGHVALHVPVETNQKLRSDDNSAMLKIETRDVVEACDKTLAAINRHAA